MEHNGILISGYARLPQGITAKELYSVIVVVIVVEKQSGVIIDADCSLVTELTKKFVKDILIGCTLNDLEPIEDKFEEYYYGSARKAIISAIKTCAEKYKQICENGDLYTD
ncbi:MAG: hypothetical protein APF77_16295 [Clostridia bacterium BRH_c25]|nr:MAG: hypothetical protein APF77_16295 [Clostridia bacterium BRH_c25]